MAAVPIAERQAWSRLRSFLIKNGFRAEDFLDQGPSGNVSIDESRLPERETDAELKERMREAFRREMERLMSE